ncbi:hypothetical protein HELRODRAFT_163413 [Helobdella robusta]|uniref:MADF domain-containing protein n=1 Tax=Helobdella robusta TaxID=6412 RepID=T1EU07_HELRO|nr:hypothetical protein HELRODRAFT_163413 [Helobdella robusta]ESN96358.1 hypothetical protein HELRODRAFT_163413 [Helobdella robusta]
MMMANRLRMDSLLQTIESSFSPNDFIEEIQARPAIWNHADPLYNNQASKRASWDTLIKKYHPEFDERPGAEQTLIASHYRRKWKSFRDSFARELAKIKNASKPRKTKYIYFNKLSFLLTVKGVPSSNIDDVESYLNDAQPEQFENDDNNANNNNNSSNINSSNNDGPDFSIFEIQPSELSSSMFKNSLPLNHQSIKRESPFEFSMNNQDEDFNNGNSRKRIKIESDCWNNNNNNSSSNSHNAVNNECDDEDKLFLLSLLSELKRVPLSIKLDVKCDLLNVFKNARLHYMPLSNDANNNGNNSMQNNNLGDNEMDEDENNIDDSPVMYSNNSNYCNANHINKNSSSKNGNDNNNDDDNNDNSSTCNNNNNNDNI